MRFRSNIIAVLSTALASSQASATCDPVSPTDVLPPKNSVVVAHHMNSVGYRSWDCINGDLVDPKQIDGAANFSDALFAPSPGAEEVPVTGGFVYIDKVARFTIVTEDGTTYQFDLEPTPTLQNVTGTLSNGRWAVDWLDDPPPPVGLADLQAYLTRTNSTGGVTPTKCDDATAKTIVVPFTTTYTLYACPDGGVTPSSGASSATAAISVFVTILVLFA